MFTLEVAGKPIAVTNASEDEAREVFESDAFKDDLMAIESEGAPIWDGFATLTIRPATREEAKDFDDAPTEDNGGEPAEEPTPVIMFLIDIDEPEEDDSEASSKATQH